jgi:hypothetical protein
MRETATHGVALDWSKQRTCHRFGDPKLDAENDTDCPIEDVLEKFHDLFQAAAYVVAAQSSTEHGLSSRQPLSG